MKNCQQFDGIRRLPLKQFAFHRYVLSSDRFRLSEELRISLGLISRVVIFCVQEAARLLLRFFPWKFGLAYSLVPILAGEQGAELVPKRRFFVKGTTLKNWQSKLPQYEFYPVQWADRQGYYYRYSLPQFLAGTP